MSKFSRLGIFCVSALIAACPTSEPDSNPYDPEAPVSVQALARVEGTVTLEGATSFADVSIVATEAASDKPVSHNTVSLDSGVFVLELPAGIYNIEISQQGFLGQFANNIEIRPGQIRKLGTFHLDIARGSLFGNVALDDEQSPTGTAISAIPLDIPNGRTFTTLAATDGSYFISGLAAGHYMVRAERQGYAPAYTSGLNNGRQASGAVEVTVESPASVPGLTLYPAAAIVKVVDANTGVIKQFTNDLDIRVELYPFVEFLTEMQVSEDPAFLDPSPTWDIAFRDFATPIDFTLSDIDGTHTVYARFRDSFGLISDAFSTTIVVDRQAPTVPLFNINNGATYLTTNDGTGTATVFFTGQDELSGINAYRVTASSAFTNEPFLPIESLSPSVSLSPQLALGDANGVKTVLLVVRDRAGNESLPVSASIIRDRVPPSLGVPALSIEPSELDTAGKVSQLQVTLLFNVTGDSPTEPLFMAVANAQGLDSNSLFVPFETPYLHNLVPGPDALAREVCAIFKDAAGLLTDQQCLSVGVDRSGTVSGVVQLEGQSTHSGALVEISHPADPTTVYSDITDATGAYQILGVPGGAGYTLRFFKTDFVEKFDYDVNVLTGTDTYRGTTLLEIPRGSVSGVVTFVDKGDGQHGGIIISDASGTYTTTTAPSGAFTLNNLPATTGASYLISARYPNYLTANFNQVDNLQNGENRSVGTKVLQKQQGDYRICANGPKTCPGGAIAYTKARTVLLDVSSTDTFWRFGLDSAFTGQPFVAFDNSATHLFTFGLAESDGPKTIYVQFSSDGSTADGATLAGVVTLDTTAPVAAALNPIVIDPNSAGVGATYSNHPTGEVLLHLAATDVGSGVSGIRIARALPAQTPDFTGLPLLGYFSATTTTLNTAVQGTQWLYVQFCDAVDNCTTVPNSPGDSIIYDTVAPGSTTGASVVVNDGDTETNSPFVTLTIQTGDAIAVRFGNTSTLTGADYISVSSSQTIQFGHFLPLGDGTKTVYTQYKDAAGNESGVSPNPNFDTIQLDTQAPTGLAVNIVGGGATNQDVISAQLTAVGASEFIAHLGTSEDFASETWAAFTGTAPTYTIAVPKAFPLPATDGNYTLYVKFRDAAGNESAVLNKPVTRDTVAPQFASVSFVEGDFTTIQTVNLILSALGATQMIVAADGVVSDEPVETYSPAKTIDLLPATVGLHTVAVRFLDAAGNFSTATGNITWDGTPPSLTSFSIAEAPYTEDTSITLQINAAGATQMRIANTSSFTGASWEAYATSRAWVLSPGDALKTVYLQLRDDAGNTTSTFQAQTTLDTTAPTSLVVNIAGGAAYATANTVNVTLSASDNFSMSQVMLANDATFSGGSWVAYATTVSNWALTAGDGAKTVYVRFRDAAGNVSESADTIIVDTQSPTASLVMANAAVATTSTTLIPISISGAGDIEFMKFVEGTGVNCNLQTINVAFNGNTTYSFSGTPAQGVLNLTVCLKDFAGLVGSAVDSIVYDSTQPAGTLQINGGTGLYTNSGIVTLTISTSDTGGSGVDAIRLANQSDMTGVLWEAPISPRTWTVANPSINELKTVWLEVRDIAGNVHTNINATITLDTGAPTGSISVVQGSYTSSTSVDLTIARGDTNTTQMAVAQGFLDCGGTSYVPFAASVSGFALTGTDGLKTISLCLRDLAGNTAGFSTTVTLDTEDPTGTLSINNGSSFTQTTGVTLNITADPDVADMKVANGSTINCATAGYLGSFNAAYPFTLTNTDGTRTVSVCLKDAAGRTVTVTDTIVLDTNNPAPATIGAGPQSGIVINNDDAYTTVAQVGLTLAASDTPAESGVTEMKISDGGACTGGNWQPYVTSASWNVQPGDNVSRTLSVQFRDASGRVSICSADSITVDTVNSTVTIFTIDGGGVTPDYTNDQTVSVTNLTFSGTCSNIQLTEDPNFVTGVTNYPCGQTWPATYNLVDYAADGSKDGQKTIYARIRDAAGNANPSVNRSIILDTQGAFSGGFVINGGATYTSSQTLSLTLTAVNATQMKISTNTTCTGGSWQAFASASSVVHPSTTSPLGVSVQFRDAANNTSACVSHTINYDPSWTGGGAILVVPVVGNAPYTTSLDVNLQLTTGEPSTSTEMKISNVAGCSGGVWQAYPAATSPQTIAWTLSSGGDNVQRTVSVQYRDAAGNVSSCYSDDIDVDTVAPSGLSLSLDSGAAYSTSSTRTVSASASGSGMADIRLSESPSFASASWVPTSGANPFVSNFVLSSGSGDKVVFLQARDAAGNVSASAASDGITLDNVVPVGATLALDAGATYSTSASGTVTVALSATDDFSGVTNLRYRTSADGTVWSSYTTVSYQPSINIVLASPVASQNGVNRWVELAYIDKAGNIGATLQDTIILDNVAPTPGGTPIQINSGQTSTTSQTVALTLSASGATEMQLSNGQVCSSSNLWQAYATAVAAWTLDGVGDNVQKYVSVRFRDAAGNTTACASTSIYVDNVGPVAQSFAIENGATTSNSNTLNLNIIYSGTATQRFISTTVAGLDSATTEDPATPATYNATGAPDGTLTLYVRFKDAAGNASNALSDTILRDRTAPTPGLFQIDNGALYSTSSSGSVNLNLSATDGSGSGVASVSYRTSTNGTTWSSYSTVSYQPTVGITLATPVLSQDGVTRYVEVYYSDAAGNTSSTSNDTILLDNVTPSLSAIVIENLAGGTATTNSTSVNVRITGYGGNPTAMRVSNNNTCTGGQLFSFQTAVVWTLGVTGETNADVSVRLIDDAGLQSPCITDAIALDTVPPSLSYVSLDGSYNGAGVAVGTVWNLTKDCYLRVWGSYVTGAYSFLDFSMSASFSSVFASLPAAQTYPYDGLQMPAPSSGVLGCTIDGANEGLRTVYFRARDAAGNVSDPSYFDVTIDTIAPVFSSTRLNSGAAATNDPALLVTVAASDANFINTLYLDSDYAGDDDDVCTGVTAGNVNYYFYGSGTSYTYNWPDSTSGVKTVFACLADGAGNTTADDNVNTLPLHRDSIQLDRVGPTGLNLRVAASPTNYDDGAAGALTCSGGTPASEHWVRQRTVSLLLTASDALSGLGQVRAAENNNYNAVPFTNVAWAGGNASMNFDVSDGDGPKMIGFEAYDTAGNSTSLNNGVCVTLDATPPENVGIAITQGAYTSTTTVDATLTGTDIQSSSTGMQMCFGATSAIQANGIRTSGGALIGSKSADATCSTASNWYTFSNSIQLWLNTGSGSRTVYLFLRDAAGNRNPVAATATTYLDTTTPTLPTLTVAQAGNKSAHLYWTSSSDPESGVAYYEIRYQEIQPSSVVYPTVVVDSGVTNYELTGLNNRYRYTFDIRAVNNAGGATAYSAQKENALGWQRFNAAFSGTNAIIPFGVAEYDGVIYVGYLKYEVVWGGTASTLHMAISSDGGASWRTSNIDIDTTTGALYVCQSRETAALYVGPSGIVVAAAFDVDTSDNGPFNATLQVGAWRSVDQGNSWERTALDGSNQPNALAGIAMSAQGGALVAFWERSSNDDTYVARSYDGGATWTAASAAYVKAVQAEAHGACNVQYNMAWYYRDGSNLNLMQSQNLAASSSLDTTVAAVNHAVLGCADPTSLAAYGRAYVLYTDTADNLHLRMISDPAVGAWSTNIELRSSGVDVLSRPALYTAGTTTTQMGFAAYRDTTGNLWVGETSTPDDIITNTWTWVQADKTGDVGVNMVMNGTAEGSPILAYTDEAGQSLFVLRSALPAPVVRPAASENKVTLQWNSVPNALSYELSGLGPTQILPDTTFISSTTTGANSLEIRGLDTAGQNGEPGMIWELAEFTQDYVDLANASIPTTIRSSTGRLIVSGSEIVALLPVGFPATFGTLTTECDSINDICIYRSTDSGANFTGQLVYNMSTTPQVAKHVSLSTNISGIERLHVANTSSFATDPDLVYSYADSPFTSWTTVSLDSTDTATVGDATGEQVQISATGAYVVAAWVQEQNDGTTSYRNVRYKYHTNYGTNSTAWVPAASGRKYVNSTNTNVDIGYMPTDLTIMDHSFNLLYLLWINSSDASIQSAWTGDITAATPTWTLRQVSPSGDCASAVRGKHYQDTHIIAWLGTDICFGGNTSVWAYVSGYSAQSATSTGWARVQIDSETAIPESLSIDGDESGFYITYATTRTLFGISTRQLKLAYCKQECAGRDNWTVNVLMTDSDADSDDFYGSQVGFDSSSNDLHIGAGWSPATSSDRYLIERGGRINRKR